MPSELSDPALPPPPLFSLYFYLTNYVLPFPQQFSLPFLLFSPFFQISHSLAVGILKGLLCSHSLEKARSIKVVVVVVVEVTTS